MSAPDSRRPSRLVLVRAATPDSGEGRARRSALAAALDEMTLDAVVCSRSAAAIATARRLSQGHGVEPVAERGLDDPAGEHTLATLRRLAAAHEDETLLLVAGERVLQAMLGHVVAADPASGPRLVPETSLTLAEVEPGGRGVVQLLNWDRDPADFGVPAADVCRVLLIRHGQSMLVEAGGQVWSHHPIGLTPRGREQAAAAAERLRHLRLAAVYSSDLVRARETAEAIAGPHDLVPVVEPGLREVGLGRFEGMTLARVHEHGDARFVPWLEVTFEEKFPTEAFHHPADLLFPDGESILVVHARARETLQALAAAHAGETIAIVSHTWVIQPLLAVLAGAGPSSYYRFGLRYATTTLADVDQSGAGRVQMVNGALDLHEVAGGRLVAGRQTEATRVGGGSPP